MSPHVLLIFQPRFDEAAEMLKGIARFQRANTPWQISLCDTARPEMDPCCWVRSRKWEGVISADTSPALLQTCAKLGVPLVDLSDAPWQPGLVQVRTDHAAVGRMGAAYLLGRRFRHFGFCGFSNHAWSSERRTGFREAVERARRRCEVFDVELPDNVTPGWEAKQIALLSAWLRCLPAEVAVMACNDWRAQQVVRAARLAGLTVPAQIAVLGANNDVVRCELADLTLSSVALDPLQAGLRAAAQLAALLSARDSLPGEQCIAPQGVITRQSTDVLGLRDESVAAALNYIREHACRGLTVDEVLQQVPVSRSNLEHKLRRYIGHSPQVEIRRVQVARICELLVDTSLSLKEIADRTGFVHVEYMCVVFKRTTGETPGQYRHRSARAGELPAAVA